MHDRIDLHGKIYDTLFKMKALRTLKFHLIRNSGKMQLEGVIEKSEEAGSNQMVQAS